VWDACPAGAAAIETAPIETAGIGGVA